MPQVHVIDHLISHLFLNYHNFNKFQIDLFLSNAQIKQQASVRSEWLREKYNVQDQRIVLAHMHKILILMLFWFPHEIFLRIIIICAKNYCWLNRTSATRNEVQKIRRRRRSRKNRKVKRLRDFNVSGTGKGEFGKIHVRMLYTMCIFRSLCDKFCVTVMTNSIFQCEKWDKLAVKQIFKM